NPILLLGTVADTPLLLTLRAIATSSIGVIALSAGLQGYLLRTLVIVERFLLIAAGLLFIETRLVTDIIALLIFGAIIMIQFIQHTSLTKERNP
ncbi:MAG: TRAP transporter permease, partial [Sphaerochaetaceae bacterium]|nr:TRAP transporter permease [Sphaerochaetaceae bacterium]